MAITVIGHDDESIESPIEERFLQIGDFFFGSGAIRLRTVLGSCVSVTMWHPRARVGGICHYLLPERGAAPSAMGRPHGLYAQEAIALFADEARNRDTRPAEYVVKLFGGGNMFATPKRFEECGSGVCAPERRSGCRVVACKNVLSGRELLQMYGFRVTKEHVGGNGSRQLVFELWNGNVWIRHNETRRPA